MATFSYLKKECVVCGIDIENLACPCPQGTLLRHDRSLWDYLFERCHQGDLQLKKCTIQIINEKDAVETIEESNLGGNSEVYMVLTDNDVEHFGEWAQEALPTQEDKNSDIGDYFDEERWKFMNEQVKEEEEIIDLIEIRHPNHPKYLDKKRTHFFWKDFWDNIPKDRTTDEWSMPEEQVYQVDQEGVPQVKVKRLTSTAVIPQRKSFGAAGYDLVSDQDITILARDRTLVGTGVSLEIPQGRHGKIRPRSGLALAGITTDGGIIDSDYRGEVMVIMVNTTNANFKIEQGDRIPQILIIRNEEHEFQEVVELTNIH